MGIFNYIDTFFFISLGITFILILLLVFHFKQRMSDLENKTETMFEIINNIVKEITSVKQTFSANICCQNNMSVNPVNPYYSPPSYSKNDNVQLHYVKENGNEKIIVSEDDENDTDDEDTDDTDDEEDHHDEDTDDSDDDTDDNDEKPPLQIIDNEVKIITVEMGDVIEIEEPEITEENESEEEAPLENIGLDNLHVEKVDESVESESVATTESNTIETSKEIYRKMTLSALKSLVISKGLASDPSKMKKNDLLKLLESE